MNNDRGVIIAKRSMSLSRSYPIIGVAMGLLGIIFTGLGGVIGSLPTNGVPVNSTGIANVNFSAVVPLLAVPLQALSALIFSTPVLLLFVYDKNNGVLEYFLSLGMNQRDVYQQYLKAALLLSVAVVTFDAVVDLATGLFEGTPGLALEISALVVVIALPAVSFGTLLMMSFGSLQKQRVGSNQPLGMAIGVFTVVPAYLLPLVLPSFAFVSDLILAVAIVGLSMLTFSLSSRLINREKLLP